MADLKRTFELTNITYLHKLSDVNVKQTFEILDKICTFMYAELSFFQQGKPYYALLSHSSSS